MAGAIVIYYRNYDSSDTTTTSSGRYTTSDPIPTIDAIGWTAPSGYQFKEWNTARDGTGLSFQPGDTAPSNDSNKYAIWEPIPVPYLVMESDLTAVADAIREKGGTSAALEWPDEFVDAIDAISGGGSMHSVNGLANPSPTVFNYDTMAWTYNSRQFAEGTPVIAAVESASRNLTVRRSDTNAEVTAVQISANTSTGIQKVFIMPDCDVTISTGGTPIK
jgi:hypothetical protein